MKCDAGCGTAAYLCELPRTGVRIRDQEQGAQIFARFRLCTIHASNLLERGARVYELNGWLDAQPCIEGDDE